MIRLFRVFVPASTLTLLISEALLIVGAYILAAYSVLQVDPTAYLLYDGGMVSVLFVLATILVALYLQDLYSDIHVQSSIVLMQQLCLAAGSALLIQGLVSYVDRALRMPLRMMLVGSTLMLATLFLWRLFFSTFAVHMVGRDRLLLVGSSPLLGDIARHVEQHPEQGVQVAGYLDEIHDVGTEMSGGKVLGRLEALREVVDAVNPSRIVVGMFERRNRVPVTVLLDLRFAGHLIEEAAACYERVCGRVSVKELRPSQLIYSGDLGPRRKMLRYQAILNTVIAAIGIVVALPLMLLTAVAVRLSSPGPVLYRQTRVGMNGRPFTLYKFRSMRADAEAVTGAVWAARDDPRITPVGRIIRKIRFDELPQLFNVLRGEMSIVGPRPERPEFVKTLSDQIPYYRQRHCVRPGITGWAQINYKYGDTLEDTITKLEYDLYYIKNVSFSMDIYIIFHTIKAMLLTRGAQ
jgi:sugar transferase (PEP-CTERM system associated)